MRRKNMSLNNIISATCPNCKKEFPFEVWNCVNAQLNPEMREKVLNGSIFNFTCPHCKFSAHTEYPILYDDMEVSKSDWKLFRERLPQWQERYMKHLVKKYIDLLNSNDSASDKFWKLEKRIKNDSKNPGVILQLKKV